MTIVRTLREDQPPRLLLNFLFYHFNHSDPTYKSQRIKLLDVIATCSNYSQNGSCVPNFEVSCPTFECLMRRFGNRSQRFAPNVPTIPTECSSKSFKFHSRSLLARDIFKRKFQDGRTSDFQTKISRW